MVWEADQIIPGDHIISITGIAIAIFWFSVLFLILSKVFGGGTPPSFTTGRTAKRERVSSAIQARKP